MLPLVSETSADKDLSSAYHPGVWPEIRGRVAQHFWSEERKQREGATESQLKSLPFVLLVACLLPGWIVLAGPALLLGASFTEATPIGMLGAFLGWVIVADAADVVLRERRSRVHR